MQSAACSCSNCIAFGAMWVDMQATGVDVLISAPQKGWSSSPCCAMVMMSERARCAIDSTTRTSFAADLKKWLQIMETYESGAHALDQLGLMAEPLAA
jgi:aspartate aminotransferase-like enzyme